MLIDELLAVHKWRACVSQPSDVMENLLPEISEAGMGQ